MDSYFIYMGQAWVLGKTTGFLMFLLRKYNSGLLAPILFDAILKTLDQTTLVGGYINYCEGIQKFLFSDIINIAGKFRDTTHKGEERILLHYL